MTWSLHTRLFLVLFTYINTFFTISNTNSFTHGHNFKLLMPLSRLDIQKYGLMVNRRDLIYDMQLLSVVLVYISKCLCMCVLVFLVFKCDVGPNSSVCVMQLSHILPPCQLAFSQPWHGTLFVFNNKPYITCQW